MVKLQIRGGDLDYTEYDFSPFSPGENINTVGISLQKIPSPITSTIHVRVPARIHLSVLDMNRFCPGTPGGGGLGFALQIYQNIEVTASHDTVIDSSRVDLISHLIAVYKKATNYSGGFTIRTQTDSDMEHIGLGSTCTMAIALLYGMNEALSSPLSVDDLRILMGYNYIEETEDKSQIVYGFETGVGALTSLNGGMNIIGDKLTPIYSHPFAVNENVYILIPDIHESSKNAGIDEFAVLMNDARAYDTFDREFKVYQVVMDFIPALAAGNLKKMGDIMWNLEFRGSKRAEIEHHSFLIYQYLEILRRAGVEFAAMSSVGPVICAVTNKTRKEMDDIAKQNNLIIALQTKTDNEGIQVNES